MKRFSKDHLRKLRNLIPINWLIREQLHIECSGSGSLFKFACPVCRTLFTGSNTKTNLARCFRCEKQFNPIELTMTVKGFTFVESVNYLTPFLIDPSDTPDNRINRSQDIRKVLDSLEKRLGMH